MSSNKLEQAALAQRAILAALNNAKYGYEFEYIDSTKQYNETNTRAMSDNATPEAGKGTGEDLKNAVENPLGGSKTDRDGNPSIPQSGRNQLLGLNLAQNGYGSSNPYGAAHTKALADSQSPEMGRGTGEGNIYDATQNTTAGTITDKDGNQPYFPGSGRNPALTKNLADWGYGPINNYHSPDTSLNVGAVII